MQKPYEKTTEGMLRIFTVIPEEVIPEKITYIDRDPDSIRNQVTKAKQDFQDLLDRHALELAQGQSVIDEALALFQVAKKEKVIGEHEASPEDLANTPT